MSYHTISERPTVGDQVFYSAPNQSLFVGRIIKETEKAVLIDYCIDSVWNNASTVYTYNSWVPKSKIKKDISGRYYNLTRWAYDSLKHFRIKKYLIGTDGKPYYL